MRQSIIASQYCQQHCRDTHFHMIYQMRLSGLTLISWKVSPSSPEETSIDELTFQEAEQKPTTQNNYKKLNWEQFEEQYKPQQNHILGEDNAPMCGWMYETFGEELAYVEQQPNNNIWTVLDVDGGTIIANGYHHVNRLGYIITEVPFADEDNIEAIDEDDQKLYYSYLRIKEDATGNYLQAGYNDKGVPDLIASWAEGHLELDGELAEEFIDEHSEYEFEEYLKKQGFTIEYSEEPFPEIVH